MKLSPERAASTAALAAENKKAEKVAILDLRGLTIMTDYFIVASAETTIQVRAIAQGVIDALVDHGVNHIRREGWEDAHWVLLDYGDLVIHIFRQEEREFYDIERLWGDAPLLTIQQLAEM